MACRSPQDQYRVSIALVGFDSRWQPQAAHHQVRVLVRTADNSHTNAICECRDHDECKRNHSNDCATVLLRIEERRRVTACHLTLLSQPAMWENRQRGEGFTHHDHPDCTASDKTPLFQDLRLRYIPSIEHLRPQLTTTLGKLPSAPI
jgi:hypothetical protein